MLIAGGEKGMVDFTFYANQMPYTDVQKLSVDDSGFVCGMLDEDRRSEETKQDNFLLAALFSKSPKPVPCRIVKFTR